ncbi:DUF1003 domain-containing protein [Jeongeupia chitinilytica]|uniref:DUF1003 domain-containing protein n=1 Tax=Jeongeupia chitinilytica TaxID=1041641 RepID=UPI0035714B69
MWIAVNVLGLVKFDVYPFILLNLAFSLQAAYAAPLILLAQTKRSPRPMRNIERRSRRPTNNGRRLPRRTRHRCWNCCSKIPS